MEELFYQYWPYVAVFFAYPVLKKVNKHIIKPFIKTVWRDISMEIVRAGGECLKSEIKHLENKVKFLESELEGHLVDYERNLKAGDIYRFGFNTLIKIEDVKPAGFLGIDLKDNAKVLVHLKRIHGVSNDGLEYLERRGGK